MNVPEIPMVPREDELTEVRRSRCRAVVFLFERGEQAVCPHCGAAIAFGAHRWIFPEQGGSRAIACRMCLFPGFAASRKAAAP